MSIDMPPPAIVREAAHPANAPVSPVQALTQSILDRAVAVSGLGKGRKLLPPARQLTPKEWGCSRACQRMVRKGKARR
jgi:hypothetical protein